MARLNRINLIVLSAQVGCSTSHYLSKRIDRYGRTVEYGYEIAGEVARLHTVKDTDGNISTITYNSSNLISSVSDPYGHTAYFSYLDGYLTNITDAAGMSSSFAYDTNQFITKMITPYGTNLFAHYSDTNLNRAVLVTEPSGDKQLFSYVPSSTAPQSYHWNRSQYNAITPDSRTNYLSMLAGDYEKAHLKEWLFYPADGGGARGVSDTAWLSAPPIDPLLGIRPGVLVFTYQGQTDPSYVGTLKRIASITRDGSTLVAIGRNAFGRPVVITNYWNGSVTAIYTNIFDSSGRYLQQQRGPRGEMVRGYGYHSVITNLLISVTNALGEVTRYTHDTNTMKVTSVLLPTLLLRSNNYSSGYLSTQRDIGVRTNSFTWSNGNLASQTNELGWVTTRSYDALNRLQQTAFPDGTTISNLYDKLDLVGIKDRLGNWTRYTYNEVRQLIGETNANGAVTTYTYCSCGSPDTVTHWLGATALADEFHYDILGRLTNATYADGYQLNYAYDYHNLLTTVSDSSGLTLTLDYTQIGQKSRVSTLWLASQQILANTYDQYGRLQGTLDRNGITVTNAYDFLHRLVTRVTLDQSLNPYATNTYTYSVAGLSSVVDALNHTTWFVHDAAGRLLYQTNANNELLQFTYNPADEMVSLTDGKGQVTHWNYNEQGLVTNKLDQASTEILRYLYDPAGRLTNRWSAAFGNTIYELDPLGNVTNILYPSGTNLSYAFDALNRLTNMIDPIGTTKFTYTVSGQLATEDGPFADDTITSSYLSRMRTNLTLAQPSGTWTNAFFYSLLQRLTNVTSRAGSFTYHYADPADRLDSLDFPSGAGIYNYYDSLSRLIETDLHNSLNITLDSHLYNYNALNQRTNETRSDSSTVTYWYDNIGQLTKADSSVNAEDRGYYYDAAWNLNRRTNNGSTSALVVDSKNELTNAPTAGTCTFDANGNMVTSHDGNRLYYYDPENQLVGLQIAVNGTNQTYTEFDYDGLNRLRRRLEYVWVPPIQDTNPPGDLAITVELDTPQTESYWVLSSETRYIYDGRRVIQERDGSNTPLVSYTRGNDLSGSLEGAGGIGGLLARSTGANYCYFADGNGNITYLLNASQGMVASYRYDPFGNIISQSGSLADTNVYRFSSKEIHVNSGMSYYGFRFYEPNLQRWINCDPLGELGSLNLFRFTRNNAISSVDPNGDSDFNTLQGATSPSALYPPAVPTLPTPQLSQGSANAAPPPASSSPPFPGTYDALLIGAPNLIGTAPGYAIAQANASLYTTPMGFAKSAAQMTQSVAAGACASGQAAEVAQAATLAERLASALKARDVAMDAVNAADEALNAAKNSYRNAAREMAEAASQSGRDSAEYARAFKAWRDAQANSASFAKSYQDAVQNWQKANAAALGCR